MSLCNHLAESSLCPRCRDDQELQTLREKNAELEKELARVRGQRDGLGRVLRSGGPMPRGVFPKIPTYMMRKAENTLKEIAQEQAQEREE